MMNAADILKANAMWEETDSDTIADNIESMLEKRGIKTLSERIDALSEATGSNEHAVYAWINHGRKDVKIPLLKLCKIADVYGVDLADLLRGGNESHKRRLAVTRVVDNDEFALKFFDLADKKGAMEYGEQVAKEETIGTISLVLSRFNDDGRRVGECKIFYVW